MNRVSIGVICGAVAYLAGVFGVVSMTWAEPIHRKAFAVAIVAAAVMVACIDKKKVPE